MDPSSASSLNEEAREMCKLRKVDVEMVYLFLDQAKGEGDVCTARVAQVDRRKVLHLT